MQKSASIQPRTGLPKFAKISPKVRTEVRLNIGDDDGLQHGGEEPLRTLLPGLALRRQAAVQRRLFAPLRAARGVAPRRRCGRRTSAGSGPVGPGAGPGRYSSKTII